MRSRLWIAIVLCLAFTFALSAQEHQMTAEQKAMMEAFEKAGTPGEEHKMLNGMVGTWNTVVRFYPAPGAPAMESTGVSENRWILGGRYLEGRFKGMAMGQPFEGVGYTGYDNIRKQYFGSWMDSMSTGVMMSTGWADREGKIWSFRGNMDDPLSGKSLPVESKITVVDNDKHVMEMWNPAMDGKMYRSMEIIYTREKKGK